MTARLIKVHFPGKSLTLHTKPNSTAGARVFSYGDELTLTEQLIQANTGRDGRCALLDMLDDEEAQVAALGRVAIRRGPWPEGVSRLEPGSSAWTDAREAERKRIHREYGDGPDKQRALDAMSERFGPLATSKTLRSVGDHR